MKDIVLCRLDPAARLRVGGPDAAAYLQGQFTNDLRRREAQPVTYGLWLNQKGRALADSFVLAHGEADFEVVSPSSPGAKIRERLEAYIIADDVTVEDETAGAAGWIIAGADAPAMMAGLGFGAPEPGIYGEAEGAVVWRARATAGANWWVTVRANESGAWAARIAARVSAGEAREVDRAELAAARVAAGIPEIPDELGPGDLPNEGGLEAEAISYTKGCYLGQEVMARLHNMGQVRRRLFVVRWRGAGEPPVRGAGLHADGRRVGELRSLFPAGDGQVGLAMLQRERVRDGAQLGLTLDGPAEFAVLHLAEGRAW